MISEEYINTYKTATRRWPVVTSYPATPPYYPPQQQQSAHYGSQSQLSIAATRAAKIGITTAEWQRRDELVRALAKECTLEFMAPFYPSVYSEWLKRGRCVYVGKPSSYAEIDNDEWPENDNVLIFHARSMNGGDASIFYCNLAFMSQEIPKDPDAQK